MYLYIYIYTTRGDVDLWTVSIIDPPIYYSLVFVEEDSSISNLD